MSIEEAKRFLDRARASDEPAAMLSQAYALISIAESKAEEVNHPSPSDEWVEAVNEFLNKARDMFKGGDGDGEKLGKKWDATLESLIKLDSIDKK